MKNTYYKKLNLPSYPLISGFDITELSVNKLGSGHLVHTADLSLLNQETLDVYASAGIEPNRIFINGNKSFKDDDLTLEKRGPAHSDVSWVDGKWQHQIFSINYELTPAQHRVVWKFWDVRAQPIYPPDPTTEPETWLAGLHYHARQYGFTPNFGNLDDYTVIDQFELTCPTMCRVEIPHSIHHTNANTQRYGMSVRFNHNFKNWDEAVEKLSPLFI